MSCGKKLTQEEALNNILKKCNENNVSFIGYNNAENEYKNTKTYLVLKCNKCGNIWNSTRYDKFIYTNHSCPNCSKTKKLSKEEIIKRINEKCKKLNFTFIGFVDKSKYNLSSKIILKCNKCGKVWSSTSIINFLKIDRKSHTCGRNNPSQKPPKYNLPKIIEKVNNKLSNSKLKFISFGENGYIGAAKTRLILKCNKCGTENIYSYKTIFSGTIECKTCGHNSYTTDEATAKIKEKCNSLNYSFLGFDTEDKKYKGKETYLILKCNKCDKIWKTTTFYSFIHNTIKCPGCKNSWKMEKEIEEILNKNKIHYIEQCRKNKLNWLKNKISLSLDFYLPDYKIAIECQGRQHFEPVLDFGGVKTYEESIERDKKKLSLCKENNIKLLYYDSEFNHHEFLGEKVFNNKESIIEEIKKYE